MEKKLFAKWMLAYAAGVAILVAVACSPAIIKTVAKGAIDVALAACIAEHPDDDEAELKQACQWADELAPIVKDLLAARNKGMAKHDGAKKAACVGSAADAGK